MFPNRKLLNMAHSKKQHTNPFAKSLIWRKKALKRCDFGRIIEEQPQRLRYSKFRFPLRNVLECLMKESSNKRVGLVSSPTSLSALVTGYRRVDEKKEGPMTLLRILFLCDVQVLVTLRFDNPLHAFPLFRTRTLDSCRN
jgi:hypothetical protein